MLNLTPERLPAVFAENVQLVTVGEEDSLYIPPPQKAVLLEKMQLVTVGEHSS